MNKTPTTLIIMDGFGLSNDTVGNAVRAANTPVLDGLFAEYAHTTLQASGLDVGLPAGQMGNSEVGHTNIGGGRVVFQDLPRITRSIEDGTFFENPAYNKSPCTALSELYIGIRIQDAVFPEIFHGFLAFVCFFSPFQYQWTVPGFGQVPGTE